MCRSYSVGSVVDVEIMSRQCDFYWAGLLKNVLTKGVLLVKCHFNINSFAY
ncbi:hypothetical protein VCHA47P369_80062 [Vibrio chagasii]|nr:hypothetical protein VCHA47P369_80062 [Vibrio chagasii]